MPRTIAFPMFHRPRMRRGPYALAPAYVVSPVLVRAMVLIVAFTLFVFLGRWTLRAIGIGARQQRASVLLVTEQGSQASVSLDGGALTRAEDLLKLYAGDRVVTTQGGVSLVFFDGMQMRLRPGADVTIKESGRGEESRIDLRLAKGGFWLKSPTADAFTGSIVRTISSEVFTMTIPSATEAVAGD